jgi:hypothetical protein
VEFFPSEDSSKSPDNGAFEELSDISISDPLPVAVVSELFIPDCEVLSLRGEIKGLD